MKKVLFIVSMMMLSTSIDAQIEYREPGSATFMPKIGLNVSNYYNGKDDGVEGDCRLGLAVGGEVEFSLSQRVGISAGVIYSMQGQTGSVYYPEWGTTLDLTLKSDYINLPVLANIYLIKGLAIKAGIQFGFNVWSKCKMSANGESVSFDTEEIGTKPNDLDIAIPIGVSYEINNLVFDARYNLGMSEAYKNYTDRNWVVQITMGYKIDL